MRDGQVLQEAPLRYAGIVSVFKGDLTLPGPGAMVVEVLAMDPPNANFGQVQHIFVVAP